MTPKQAYELHREFPEEYAKLKRLKEEISKKAKHLARMGDPAYEEQRRRQKARTRIKSRNIARYKACGITPERVAAMIEAQGNRCAICHRDFGADIGRSGRGPQGAHVDHDHATDQVRGLLCRECNLGIGHLKDSLELAKAAVEYLARPPATIPGQIQGVA